jgi:hypothetical protein
MDISCAAGFTMSGVRVGNDRSNGGRNWLGDICEVYIYNTVLSAADRNSNESYLAAKYAL